MQYVSSYDASWLITKKTKLQKIEKDIEEEKQDMATGNKEIGYGSWEQLQTTDQSHIFVGVYSPLLLLLFYF